MFVASSFLTLLGLMVLATGAAAAYLLIPRKPPSSNRRPIQPAQPQGAAVAADPGAPDMPPPPPPRLVLSAVVERMANVGDDETTFLDPDRNKLITLGDQLLSFLEDDDEIEESVEYDRQELEDLRAKLKSKKLLQLPTKAETNEFEIQERFCDGLPDGEAKAQMFKVLNGQTGFRSFDGAVKRLGIDTEWQRLRDGEFALIAVAWLEKNGLEFDHDMEALGEAA